MRPGTEIDSAQPIRGRVALRACCNGFLAAAPTRQRVWTASPHGIDSVVRAGFGDPARKRVHLEASMLSRWRRVDAWGVSAPTRRPGTRGADATERVHRAFAAGRAHEPSRGRSNAPTDGHYDSANGRRDGRQRGRSQTGAHRPPQPARSSSQVSCSRRTFPQRVRNPICQAPARASMTRTSASPEPPSTRPCSSHPDGVATSACSR